MDLIKNIILIVCLAFLCTVVQAQDVLILKNKTEYKVSIIEVKELEIIFKVWDDLEGDSYSINKEEVSYVIYQDGRKVDFSFDNNTKQNTSSSPTISSPNNNLSNSTVTSSSIIPTYINDESPKNKEVKEKRKGVSPKGIQFYLGVAPNTITTYKVPIVSFLMEGVTNSGIAISTGATTGLKVFDTGKYKINTFSNMYMLGLTYYLNRAFKFKTSRPAIYLGMYGYMNHNMHSYKSALSPSSTEKFSQIWFSGSAKFGVSYNFIKKMGVFCEVHYGLEKQLLVVTGIRISGKYTSNK